MMRRRTNPDRGRGQALVEFALIVPIFVLVLVGILDLGRAVYYSSTLNNAAREGARLGITDQMCKDIYDKARTHSVGVSSNAAVTIRVLNPDASLKATCPATPAATDHVSAALGDFIDVTVTFGYTAATPIIGNLVGTIQLKGESKFVIESPCTTPAQAACPLGE
jgi:Flp pilus assembly protein TadG